MGPARWQQIWEVFHAVAEEPRSSRATSLERLCGENEELRREVESLLESFDEPADFLDHPEALVVDPEETVQPGQRLGPYEVLRELGEGGMGVVYLARRADDEFERQVAIKVLRGGFEGKEAERRFRLERQILAGLDHPHIAKLLDGGSTADQRPYLVLELIEGVPIDEYCERDDLGLEDRLRLFCKVCDAVDYAHRRLVVHRDLKPGNILVTADGDPKLLDFGIAKLLSDDPRATRTRIMTPGYASPEQIRGEPIQTASDVYALGVLLYELLVGCSPYRAKTDEPFELARQILEDEPERPSRALSGRERDTSGDVQSDDASAIDRRSTSRRRSRRLEGDLDTIVLTALRKDTAQRYAGAAPLAADIRSYLDGRPIAARPDTVSYLIGKFVRRHRVGVGAVAAIVILLIGATVLTSLLSLRLSRALAGADRERQKAELVAGFLTELFETSDPVARLGEEVSTRDILDRGSERIRSELAAEPEVQADLMMVMGVAYRNLGSFESAVELFGDALALRKELFGPSHPEVAETLVALGPTLREQGELERAEQSLRQALGVHSELNDNSSAELGVALDELGVVQFYAGRYDEAEETLRRALALRRETLGSDHPDTATSMNDLALALDAQAEYGEAEILFRESLEVEKRVLEPDHPDNATTMMNLAGNLRSQSKLEEAEPFYREALEIRRRLYGERHPEVAIALHNLTGLLRITGRLDEAEANIRLALDITREYLGPDHEETARRMATLAIVLGEKGNYSEAADLEAQVLTIHLSRLGPNHPATAIATSNHALTVRRLGDLDTAETETRLAVERFRAAFGGDHPNTAIALGNLGDLLTAKGTPESAEPLLRQALAIQTGKLAEKHWRTAVTRLKLGSCLAALHRFEEAEPLLLNALEVFDSGLGSRAHHQRTTLRQLVELYLALGRPEDAAIYRARLDASEASGTS